MPCISIKVIKYRLNVELERKPIQQRQRAFAPERNQVITDKVNKLLSTSFIRKVYYPNWLNNVFLVKKANGK